MITPRERMVAFAENAACAGQVTMFTAEARNVRAGSLRAMKRLCAGCQVMDLCAQLRDEINPSAGVWAGQLCLPHGGRR